MVTSDESMRAAPNFSQAQALLITGGSGFLGQHLVRMLSEQGRNIVSMYRYRLPEPMEGVFPVCSDLSTEELLLAPLRGVETVVHLAWEGSIQGPGKDSQGGQESKNLALLGNLLRALEKAKTKRLVFISALGAQRDADHPFLREKYQGELLVLNSKVKECLVVRPAILYGGTGGRFIETIRQLLRFPGTYPLPYCPKKLYPLHVQDLSRFLINAAKHPFKNDRTILEISGDRGYEVEEIFRYVAQSQGKNTILRLRSFIGHGLFPLFERIFLGPQEPRMGDYLRLLREACPLELDESKAQVPFDLLPHKRQSLSDFLHQSDFSTKGIRGEASPV